MAKRKSLTPAILDGPICVPISDPETPGLSIRSGGRGRKIWEYRRRLSRSPLIVKVRIGVFPALSIADARQRARELNEQVEAGIDPRAVQREEELRSAMTVDRAHHLYMVAVREGRSSRAKRPNKPRTFLDKQQIYQRDVRPRLGGRIIYDVTEAELVRLVTAKGKVAKIRANRLAAELKVFFGWTASLRGMEVGLQVDPSRRLADLRFPEKERSRKLSFEEIGWFLQGLVGEKRDYRRGMLLMLLTAARRSEVAQAHRSELADGVWTIPADRTKNSVEHRIALGPWGWALMQTNGDWVFPSPRLEGPLSLNCWYKARNRIHRRMERLAGRSIERFSPHDFRRTARSNTKRLRVDYETAEAMLNHVKKGLERTYDTYELEEEKRAWFLKWETEIADIARRLGIADELGVPPAPECSAVREVEVTDRNRAFLLQSLKNCGAAANNSSLLDQGLDNSPLRCSAPTLS